RSYRLILPRFACLSKGAMKPRASRVGGWGGRGVARGVRRQRNGGNETAAPVPSETVLAGTPIEADSQRPGDADAGYRALVHEGYVGCGVPLSIYQTVFGAAPPERRLPGREGESAEMA